MSRRNERCRGGRNEAGCQPMTAAAGINCSSSRRRSRGSVIPLLAVSLVVLLAIVGICVDLMRDVQTSQQLKFASQTAALYGLSLAANSNGSYSLAAAQANIANAIQTVGIAQGWNQAQVGPFNNIWSLPVTFGPANIQFVPNPNQLDANDFFVQLSAQSVGQNALTQFFLPVLYMTWPSGGTTQSLQTVGLTKIVEVLGQPASRVGAAAPPGSQGPSANFLGFGVFPVAISNRQFAAMALSGQPNTPLQVTIDFVSSVSTELTGAAPAGHVKGCFVDVAPSGNSGSFYGTATSLADFDQLQSLLSYFGTVTGQPAVPPTAVERGSTLAAYDPASAAFNMTQIVQPLNNFAQSNPNNCYMLPVLVNDPSFVTAGGQPANVVAGFALVRLNSVASVNGTIYATITLQPSVPMRNASCANGLSTTGIPGSPATLMPAPVAPFLPRQVDVASGGITARPIGVVFAPAVSPRQIVFPPAATL